MLVDPKSLNEYNIALHGPRDFSINKAMDLLDNNNINYTYIPNPNLEESEIVVDSMKLSGGVEDLISVIFRIVESRSPGYGDGQL